MGNKIKKILTVLVLVAMMVFGIVGSISAMGYGNLTQKELECIYSPIGYGNMTQCELEKIYGK